jgi:hypothetical protein
MSEIFSWVWFQNSLSIRKKRMTKQNALIRRSENRSNENNDSNNRNKLMYQTILSAEKIDSRIVQELNDTKKTQSYFYSIESSQSIKKTRSVQRFDMQFKIERNSSMKCCWRNSKWLKTH